MEFPAASKHGTKDGLRQGCVYSCAGGRKRRGGGRGGRGKAAPRRFYTEKFFEQQNSNKNFEITNVASAFDMLVCILRKYHTFFSGAHNLFKILQCKRETPAIFLDLKFRRNNLKDGVFSSIFPLFSSFFLSFRREKRGFVSSIKT